MAQVEVKDWAVWVKRGRFFITGVDGPAVSSRKLAEDLAELICECNGGHRVAVAVPWDEQAKAVHKGGA